MPGSRPPWSVSVAGVLVLMAASLTGIVGASDPGSRQFVLPAAIVVGFVGLGLVVRWRWAVWAGFALVPLSVPLTVAAFRSGTGSTGGNDGQLGVMMVWATVFLLLLLLPAVPALRGRPDRRAMAVGETGTPPEGEPCAERPPRGARLLFVLFAVAAVIVGMLIMLMVLLFLSSGSFRSGKTLIATVMLFVILLMFGVPMVVLRPRRRLATFDLGRLSVDGATSQAFLARYDRLGRSILPAILICPAAIGIWQLIKVDTPQVIWVPAAILTALAAVVALALPATGWRSYVALTPAGLYVPGPRRPTVVPWPSVGDSCLTRQPYGGVFVTVAVSDPAAVTSSRAGRLARLINRGFGGDLQFPARLLATEPELLAYAIDVYRRHPRRRQAIGTAEELDRLRSEWRSR